MPVNHLPKSFLRTNAIEEIDLFHFRLHQEPEANMELLNVQTGLG